MPARRGGPGHWPWPLPRGVEHGTGVGALGAIGEQPALPANHKGTDGILGGVIVDGQVAVFQVGGELRPQVERLADRFAEFGLGQCLLGLAVQPALMWSRIGRALAALLRC